MATLEGIRKALWHLRRGGPRQVSEWLRRRRIDNMNGSGPSGAAKNSGQPMFGPHRIPDRAPRRSDLTVGVILDDFSAAAFAFEWNLVHLRKDDWSKQLAENRIDFLFVESAWNGNGGSWQYQLMGASGPKREFVELMNWCREQDVPTVFWNKEDPPHYEDFLASSTPL